VAEQSTFARRMMAQKLMAEKRDDPFSDSRFFAGKMRPSMDDIENPTRLSDMAGPAYGAAATGSLFVPGSGFADVFGGLANPSQPGEMLPSFGANVRQGNYLDAGLQTLGVAGDVALAAGAVFPPALPGAVALGTMLKAPRAARVAKIGQGGLLSEVGESAIKNVGSIGTNTPLTKEGLEKADETTKLLVSKILEKNPDAALGLVRSGSAAGDSNYLTFVTPSGAQGQIRISDHSTGEKRMSDYFAMLPMKIPPDGQQVFGQISKKSYDDSIDKIVQLMASPKIDTNEMKTVLDLRADQMQLPVKDRLQPSGDAPIFNIENVPGQNQSPYERTLPEQIETPVPRAPEGVKLPLNNRGAAVIQRSDEIADVLAERAQPLVGTNVQYFYHTGPLIEKAVDLGIPEETARQQLKKFALNYAATSPRTMTEQNLRNASLVSAKQQRGIELTDMIGPGGEGVNEKGYPMMINPGGIHKKLIDEAAADGINFNTNPKPATFAENVSGNLAGVTADTHAIRAVFDAMNEIEPGSIPIEFIGGKNATATKEMRAKYLADPSSLDPATMINDTLATQKIGGESVQTEYAIFSDIYKKVAQRLGVQPAEAQSLSWFANGKKTGLASEPKTIVELIDERVDVTAKALKQPKDTVFKKFMQGSIPLLSVGGLTLLDTGAMQSVTNDNDNGGSILPDAGIM
jgi:hypothetical protein